MSSMGDVVHTLPAVTDLKTVHPQVQVDWVVEEAFVDIPASHPMVSEVIPIAIRRWRRNWLRHWQEIKQLQKRLKDNQYDLVVDAQGLIKSAFVSRFTGAQVHGLDANSAREPAVSWLYSERHAVTKSMHAVERVRQLFSQIFDYALSDLPLNYGFPRNRQAQIRQLLFLPGTTWASKHWPESLWRELIERATIGGFKVLLPHGNDIEEKRAIRLAKDIKAASVLRRSSIAELIQHMQDCVGVVSVDTGLGHLAGAMDLPLVGIYGSTNPRLTGMYGSQQEVIVSDNLPCIPCLKRECRFKQTEDYGKIHPPCYTDITAERVFEKLTHLIANLDNEP